MPGTTFAASQRATAFSTTCSRARITILSSAASRSVSCRRSGDRGRQAAGQQARLLGDAALVVEAELRQSLVPAEPGGARDLPGVEVRGVAALVLEQEVVDALVDAQVALLDVPVFDLGQRRHHPAGDAGLLPDLAHGGLLGGLAVLDVPLGQLPAPPLLGRDQQDGGAADDQAARGPVALGLDAVALPGALSWRSLRHSRSESRRGELPDRLPPTRGPPTRPGRGRARRSGRRARGRW